MAYLLQHLLVEAAERFAEREAVVAGERALTYRELDEATVRLADLLTGLGAGPGSRVGIFARRGIEPVVAALGTLKAGAAYVPLDPLSSAGRLRSIVDACAIEVVITTADGQQALREACGPRIQLVVLVDGLASPPLLEPPAQAFDWTAPSIRAARAAPDLEVIDTDTAYILFTSGSTGLPKGVEISHLNALAFVNVSQAFFEVGADDRLSNVCSLHADMSVFDIYVALKVGACVVAIPETATIFPARLAETIAKGRVTIWNSVPSVLALLSTLSNLEAHDLGRLRLILFAGEVFPSKALRRLQEGIPGARYCNMYGQTEANTSTYHWVEPVAEDARGPIPIGRALPNFDVFALDADGRRVVGAGAEGELYIRASTVAKGYWHDPERTAAAFVANPLDPGARERVYRTGDMVRLDPNGEFIFLGRQDLMIKSRGYRVEIGEIEDVLRNHPAIRNAVVIPIPDERIGNRLSAIIELAVPGSLGRDEVLAYCVAELPHYMVPADVAFRDSLPMTSSGKVDRVRLAQP